MGNFATRVLLGLFHGKRCHDQPPWLTGDNVFVCHNDVGLAAISPLVDEMTAQGVASTLVFQEGIYPRSIFRAKSRSVNLVRGACWPDNRASVEITGLLNIFRNQATNYFTSFGVQDASVKIPALVAQAHYTLTCIELVRTWIRRARPERVIVTQPKEQPLWYSLAARLEGVPAVISPHGVLRGREVFRPAFYDLGLFDIGLLRSYRCAEVARALNPNIQTIVTGFSGMEKRVTEEHERRYCSGRQGKPARLGMAAGQNLQDVKDIARAAAQAGIELWVKGRPPGGDGGVLRDALRAHPEFKVFAYEEITLGNFLACIDGIVCTRSNVAYHAAAQSVPVIYWKGLKSSNTAAGPRNCDQAGIPEGVGIEDIALFTLANKDELVQCLSTWCANSPETLISWGEEQFLRYRKYFPRYEAQTIVRRLLSC